MKIGFRRALALILFSLAACAAPPPGMPPDEAFSVGKELYDQQNYTDAFKPLLVAANAGNAEASFMVGDMYELGLGTEPDLDEATRYYLDAAERGHGDAQYRIASRYEYGRYIDRDRIQSLKWYLLASRNESTRTKLRHASTSQVNIYLQIVAIDCSVCRDRLRLAEGLADNWKPKQ